MRQLASMPIWQNLRIHQICIKRFQYRSCHSLESNFDVESNISRHERISIDKRDLILTILNSTATKREARSYLSKYSLLEENDIYKNKQKIIDFDESAIDTPLVTNERYSTYIGKMLDKNTLDERQDINGVLKYSSTSFTSEPLNRSESPVIISTPNTPQRRVSDASNEIKLTSKIRACIIRLSRLDKWSKETVAGLGNVLRKAMCLGASPVIIIDGDIIQGCKQSEKRLKEQYLENKLEEFIDELSSFLPCRIVQGCFDLQADGKLDVVVAEMIGVPIFSGIVPILSPVVVRLGDLVKEFVEGPELTSCTIECLQSPEMKDMLSVEKIVLVNEVGGFPSAERSQGSHVLINLLQEYDVILEELTTDLSLSSDDREVHLNHLKELKYLLDKYPSMTGILTTPEMAATEEEKQVGKASNPIIFNILTDRATISSSLPVSLRRTPHLNTTIVKDGIPVDVFLAKDSNNGLDLLQMDREGKIDLKKLKFLIDDSFGRDLNIKHYLNRINGKVAGLIVAGDYEGGAIITYEDAGDRSVAYLDKLAVVKKLQGIPGIADVIFKAMVTSFDKELLWRSRKNNPVNKWYFERSKANYSIDGTQWRLFVAGQNEFDEHILKGYVKICSSIEPSFDIQT